MNAFGDATFALALFLLIQQTGTLELPGRLRAGGRPAARRWRRSSRSACWEAPSRSRRSCRSRHGSRTRWRARRRCPRSSTRRRWSSPASTSSSARRRCSRRRPRCRTRPPSSAALTLVVAGLIALVQTDIKRVIAYSTMSQIGYMFLAVGIGAYATGMFHLLTHAFFKALLFLAAGILIHALAGEQDLRQMGGLRRLMPFTYVAFLVGALALVGVPPFSGFFSKDPILANALDAGEPRLRPVRARRGRRVPHRPLHVPHDLPRVRRRAIGGAPGALSPARRQGRAALDGLRRRRSSPCSRPSPASSSSRRSGRRSTTSSTRWRSRSSTRRTAMETVASIVAVCARPRRHRRRLARVLGEASAPRRGRGRCSSRSSTSTGSTTRSSTGPPSRRRRSCTRSSKDRSSAAR